MAHVRVLSLVITILFVVVVGFAVSMLARGYRFDSKKFSLKPTGLLVATSNPDGAQILVNRELESATNATISLPPETYDIEIKKEGYLPWKKRLTIKKEEVTRADAILFPAAPSLNALTFSGVTSPTLSPDGTKIVFGIPSEDEEKIGLWIMEIGNLPIGFSSDPRRISNIDPASANWAWSPDSRQLLVTMAANKFVVPVGSFTPQKQLVNLQGTKLDKILEEWKIEKEKRLTARSSRLPDRMKDIIEKKASKVSFSLDGDKVLYTASGSATIADNLIPALPGASTQKQERGIKDGQTYVYDVKEDRNFLITTDKTIRYNELSSASNTQPILDWFTTSNHLILVEQNKITIMDHDGTNRQAVWSGPFEFPFAIPYPNSSRLLMLTKLGAGNGNIPNLYAVILK